MEALFISHLILRETLDGSSARALLEGVQGLMLSAFLVYSAMTYMSAPNSKIVVT